jgi:hypothetical protein
LTSDVIGVGDVNVVGDAVVFEKTSTLPVAPS